MRRRPETFCGRQKMVTRSKIPKPNLDPTLYSTAEQCRLWMLILTIPHFQEGLRIVTERPEFLDIQDEIGNFAIHLAVRGQG